MKKKSLSLLLVFMSVLLVDSGQLLLKKGLLDVGATDFSSGVVAPFLAMFTNPIVLLAIFLMVISSFTWLLALSKANLSFAFPFLSIGYVIVSILSWYFFGDNLSSFRLLGLGIIVGGVFFMSRT